MDSFQGISTGLAVAAMSLPKRRRVFSHEFANQLLEFGDEYADIGQLWLDGADLRARGKKLSGWFVGKDQNAEARALIFKGHRMQRRAENGFSDLVGQDKAQPVAKAPRQEKDDV